MEAGRSVVIAVARCPRLYAWDSAKRAVLQRKKWRYLIRVIGFLFSKAFVNAVILRAFPSV